MKTIRSGSIGGLVGVITGSVVGPFGAFFMGYAGEYVFRKTVKAAINHLR